MNILIILVLAFKGDSSLKFLSLVFFCHPGGTEKRKCAFMQNRLALPFDPVAHRGQPRSVWPQQRTAFTVRFSRLIHECMCILAETVGDWPDATRPRCSATIRTWAMARGRRPMENAFSIFVLPIALFVL